MYYSGIDQHKRDCLITTYDDGGQRVKQQRVPNDRQRLRSYFMPPPPPQRIPTHPPLRLPRQPGPSAETVLVPGIAQ